MTEEFRVLVLSTVDDAYKDLVAEIYIGEEFVGLLSQEAGPGQMVFELAAHADTLKVQLSTFEAALGEAKSRLWDLRRTGPAPG